MKWALWLFNAVMALGMIAVFVALYYSCRYTIAKYQPAPAVNTPLLNSPTPVIKTPRNNAEYQGIVNNCLFYQERKMPTPEPVATPPSSTVTPGGATPVPPAPQSEPLVNLKYVTHFVNWGTPFVHLEVMVNPQTGVSSLEKLMLNDEFRRWKVCEISARRVVLKGIINNEEVYHVFSPALNPTGQQISKQIYAKLLQQDAEANKEGLPASTATTPEDLVLTPPKPAPAPVVESVIRNTPTPESEIGIGIGDGSPPAPTQPINGDDLTNYSQNYLNGKKKEEGKYFGHSKEGLWNSYYENGQLQETGNYQNNKRTGNWIRYNPNGTKNMEGVYVNNIRDGKWSFWDEDGNYIKDIFYKNGNADDGKQYKQAPQEASTKKLVTPRAPVPPVKDKTGEQSRRSKRIEKTDGQNDNR